MFQRLGNQRTSLMMERLAMVFAPSLMGTVAATKIAVGIFVPARTSVN